RGMSESDRESFSPEVCERLYRTVVWVAHADGVDAVERATLERLRERLGIDPERAAALERDLGGAPEHVDDPAAQRALCRMVAEVVAADGMLTAEEQARAEALVPAVGLDPGALRAAILDRLMPLG